MTTARHGEMAPPNSLSQFGVELAGLPSTLLFTGCEGLRAEYEMMEYAEGGNNVYTHKIPMRVKYPNIKLTRTVSDDSNQIAKWFSGFAANSSSRRDGTIKLFNFKFEVVCTWELQSVHPVSWSGPSFSAESSAVAKETLEIAHLGFKWKAG